MRLLCFEVTSALGFEFPWELLEYMEEGHTYRETAEVFKVDTKTILKWRKLRQETGELNDRPRETWHKKIAPEKLMVYYEENPDSYLCEAAEVFGCSANAIFKAKKRLGITRKKNETLCGKV